MGDSDQLPGAKDVERLPVGNSWAETDIFYLDQIFQKMIPVILFSAKLHTLPVNGPWMIRRIIPNDRNPDSTVLCLESPRTERFELPLSYLQEVIPVYSSPTPPRNRAAWRLPSLEMSPEQSADFLISQSVRLRVFRTFLVAFLEEFGSFDAMRGLKVLELGAAGTLGLFEFLDDIGVNIDGVDRSPTVSNPHIHACTYAEYAGRVSAEPLDLIYSKLSFYPGLESVPATLASLSRMLKPGAPLIFTMFESEQEYALDPKQPLASYGMQSMDDGLPAPEERSIRFIWRKIK